MLSQNRNILLLLVSLFVVMATVGSGQASILLTKHNLSVSGTGTVTATDESRVCIFCHTPHHASMVQPLWSRKNSTAIYDLYASTSLVAQPGQPTGASRLCLSCHDGTIAIGMLEGLTTPIQLTGGITTMPIGPTNLATDLSDDHPISFGYTSALAAQKGELVDPLLLQSAVKLDQGLYLECTSCHDPHKDPYGMFLVMSNVGSALCVTCHEKAGWTQSSHSTDLAVSDQACQSCHQNHGAPGAQHLLKNQVEEANCLTDCHNGVGAGINVLVDSNKFYNHPVNYATGIHDVTEDPLTMAKHVECSDCHNPHQVSSLNAPLALPPAINGRLTGVRGVSTLGTAVAAAANEYEVCFNCHADNPMTGLAGVTRMIQETNERLRFDSANPSFHPVTAPGVNPNVPSLRPEYDEASLIYCTDCHGSDSSVRVGSTGADGPHGSIYPHILIAQYEQDAYPTTYTVSSYALCFRCHDPDALFNPNISTFGNSHKSHVQNHGAPCSACHDPHGVPVTRGATTAENAFLINFDVRFVDPLTATYDSVAKSCTVSCHTSNPKSY